MSEMWVPFVLEATGAKAIEEKEVIQTLWSGYGEIVRVHLRGSPLPSVIVKHVQLPDAAQHPRGWDGELSHLRKIRSYEVEMEWYDRWAERSELAPVPMCFGIDADETQCIILLEDLDACGFDQRNLSNPTAIRSCLTWLAHFHATFMGEPADGLWPTGTYWHLATRPDEWEVIDDMGLKRAAKLIDDRLNNCTYQTIVHGDAKLANFCFAGEGEVVAAVDFQYVGGGCGMKDVAYFFSSCLSEEACQAQQDDLLDLYFSVLRDTLAQQEKQIDTAALEAEWRDMYAFAWADFYRFLKGWAPDHYKVNGYSQQMADDVVIRVLADL